MQQDWRVLVMSTTAAIGGVERVALTLSRGLLDRSCRVQTVFPGSSFSAETDTWAVRQGVCLDWSPNVRTVFQTRSIRDVARLWWFVRRSRADAVNIHYPSVFISLKDAIAVRLAGRKRIVVSVHHPDPWEQLGGAKRLTTRLAAFLVNAVVVPSGATRDRLLEAGIAHSKISVVPIAVPPPGHRLTKIEARTCLGLPMNTTIIGTLARLEPAKGVGDLIRALARLPAATRPFLLVGGDGTSRADLESLAVCLLGDGFRFLGRLADQHLLHAAIDIFALPSHLEGFGIVYVEAALHQVPSVALRVGGVPEAVVDGLTGILVDPSRGELLSSALTRLAGDQKLRDRMGLAALHRAEHRNTLEVMVGGYWPVLFDAPMPRPAGVDTLSTDPQR